MLELNISFDVLLECFSDFFTNMSMTAVFSTGRHWHKCTGVRSLCRISWEPRLFNRVFSHSVFSHLFCVLFPMHQCSLYAHWNTCITSMLCVGASLKDTYLLPAHFQTEDLLSIPMETWKGAGTEACQCAYSTLHKQWKIRSIISP